MEVKSDALRAILHRDLVPVNVRSMNQDKLEVVKQEMARVKIDILEDGKSEDRHFRNQ